MRKSIISYILRFHQLGFSALRDIPGGIEAVVVVVVFSTSRSYN